MDFADVGAKPETIAKIMEDLGNTGISYVLPTIVSLDPKTLKEVLVAIDSYVGEQEKTPVSGRARIVGIHLEGPFIAQNCKGSHNPEVLEKEISLDKFKKIIANAPHIKEWKITLAPDLPGALQFIEDIKLLEKENISVKIFLGHSNASEEQIDNTVKTGKVSGFTHLGNACKEGCSRDIQSVELNNLTSNLVRWAVKNAEVCPAGVEIITDGQHLSQEFVRFLEKYLKGKTMIVTDALGPSGCDEEKIYQLGSMSICKKDNIFYLADEKGEPVLKDGILPNGEKGQVPAIAGSGASLAHCIKTYFNYTNTNEANSIRNIYPALIENTRKSSLSANALVNLPDDENFALFNDKGELVISLTNGKLREHRKDELFKKNTYQISGGFLAENNRKLNNNNLMVEDKKRTSYKL